jgi:sugar (pentulose or hexulose) kinase
LIAAAGLPETSRCGEQGRGEEPALAADSGRRTGRADHSGTTEGAYGAALLAAVGAGIYPDVHSACAATITTGERTTPGGNQQMYPQYYAVYQSLYPLLKDAFAQL